MWAGGSKAGIKGKNLVSFVHSYPGFGVFFNEFFEEIRFPLEADHFHPFKRVADFVVSLVAEGNQELVGAELDVVTHHGQVHPDNKFHFDVDCAADDVSDTCCRKAVDQFRVEEACKVAVESFVMADQFVAEAEARHKSALFEPEYGIERAREENAFNSGKCNHTFREAGIGGVAPFESPVGFALDAWYYFDGVK